MRSSEKKQKLSEIILGERSKSFPKVFFREEAETGFPDKAICDYEMIIDINQFKHKKKIASTNIRKR